MVSPAARVTLHRLIRAALLCAIWHGVADTAAAQARPELTEPSGPSGSPLLSEPDFIKRSIDFGLRTIGDGSDVRDGLYPEFSNMVTGAGWISAGPGYRRWLHDDHLLVDVSAAVSWRAFMMGQARVELPRLARSRLSIGSQVLLQDLRQITYFGEGPDSAESARSEYRIRTADVVAYATIRPRRRVAIAGQLGWLSSPALLPPGGTFMRGNPPTEDVFPDDAVFARGEQPSYLHLAASLTADTRDHRSHPTQGNLLRAAWSAYAERDDGPFRFQRYEAEAATFVPIAHGRWVLAAHGWLVASRTDDDRSVPFYLMPSLGGENTLRSFADYRFHDRHLLVVNAETRLALTSHTDAAVFVDAGTVASRLADLGLNETSYGIGLRMHTRRSNFARLDVAHGREGWRVVFKLGDPLHLSRLSRRTAAAPFVP